MIKTIDLNADLGEGMAWDIPLLERVTSANVSCGAHAGDPAQITETLLEARRRGVIVGAHPGWPDREGFGRIEQKATRSEIESLVMHQVNVLKSLADPLGIVIRYIKPHGALYNQAMQDNLEAIPIATGLLSAAKCLGLPLVGLPETPIERIANEQLVRYVKEGFPDRRYDQGLRLIARKEANALIDDEDEAVAQAMRLAKTGVDSLCIHGDSPKAVSLADAILLAFSQGGIMVKSFIPTT